MNKKQNKRYYLKEFKPNKYHIHDRECSGLPIYDSMPFGMDKPLVFDEDNAWDYMEELNKEYET
jgi:hypothetical protein